MMTESMRFWLTLIAGGVITVFILICLMGIFILIQTRLRDGKWPRCTKLQHGKVGGKEEVDGESKGSV